MKKSKAIKVKAVIEIYSDSDLLWVEFFFFLPSNNVHAHATRAASDSLQCNSSKLNVAKFVYITKLTRL